LNIENYFSLTLKIGGERMKSLPIFNVLISTLLGRDLYNDIEPEPLTLEHRKPPPKTLISSPFYSFFDGNNEGNNANNDNILNNLADIRGCGIPPSDDFTPLSPAGNGDANNNNNNNPGLPPGGLPPNDRNNEQERLNMELQHALERQSHLEHLLAQSQRGCCYYCGAPFRLEFWMALLFFLLVNPPLLVFEICWIVIGLLLSCLFMLVPPVGVALLTFCGFSWITFAKLELLLVALLGESWQVVPTIRNPTVPSNSNSNSHSNHLTPSSPSSSFSTAHSHRSTRTNSQSESLLLPLSPTSSENGPLRQSNPAPETIVNSSSIDHLPAYSSSSSSSRDKCSRFFCFVETSRVVLGSRVTWLYCIYFVFLKLPMGLLSFAFTACSLGTSVLLVCSIFFALAASSSVEDPDWSGEYTGLKWMFNSPMGSVVTLPLGLILFWFSSMIIVFMARFYKNITISVLAAGDPGYRRL